MPWPLIVALVVGTWLIRLGGLLLPAGREPRPVVTSLLGFVPVALLAALIAVQTVSTEGTLTIDARLVGVAAALVAIALRAPFGVVFIVGVGATAIGRALGA